MRIYNRWGASVFSTANLNASWNGNNKNEKQPAGSYVYIIEFKDENGKKRKLFGSIVLIR
jgi:gliding motility-associated-like protein